MKDGGVRTAAHDGRVAGAHGPVRQVDLLHRGLDLVLVPAWTRGAHARAMGGARDLDAAPEDLLLERRLHLAQPVHEGAGVLHGHAEIALAHPRGEEEGRLQGIRQARRGEREVESGPPLPQRLEKRVVFAGLRAPRHAVGPLREGSTHESIELGSVVHGGDAALRGHLFLREDVALPVLVAGVSRPREQDLLLRLVPGHEDEDRVLLVDAGEVEKVAVLPVLVVHVQGVEARGRAPHDEHGVGPQLLHEPRAPGLEVVLPLARQEGSGRTSTHEQVAGELESCHRAFLPEVVGRGFGASARLDPSRELTKRRQQAAPRRPRSRDS